jgi:hypothetical protein
MILTFSLGGDPIGAIFDWVESYWFELTSFTVQFTILAVLMWHARSSLPVLIVSQRQA